MLSQAKVAVALKSCFLRCRRSLCCCLCVTWTLEGRLILFPPEVPVPGSQGSRVATERWDCLVLPWLKWKQLCCYCNTSGGVWIKSLNKQTNKQFNARRWWKCDIHNMVETLISIFLYSVKPINSFFSSEVWRVALRMRKLVCLCLSLSLSLREAASNCL